MSPSLREAVCSANRALPRHGLVTAHSGNASGLDRDSGVLYIKPSGFDYDAMQPEDMVAVELATGLGLADGRTPSVDLPHHLFLYRNLPEIGGIVHTHSNYATAFAACGMAIPCMLTAIADEFGGEVPCAPYCGNAEDEIGRAILAHRAERAPAILLANHGVFAWGRSVDAALKAAIMVEDVARTVFLAMQLGKPSPLPPEEIEAWWDRYQNRYGQREGS